MHGIMCDILFACSPEVESTLHAARAARVVASASADVPDSRNEWSVSAALRLCRLVRKWAPDVVHLHYGGVHIPLRDVLAVRLGGVRRCIVTTHSATPWSVGRERTMASTRMAAFLCDFVIVHSNATKTRLVECGVPAAKVRVLPVCVPSRSNTITRNHARKLLGLPKEAIVIATAARLVVEKGIGTLIAAMQPVIAANPAGVRLLVAGGGSDRERLEALAAQLPAGSVIFTGYLADVAPVYASSDIFVLPSEDEGFGLVFLEAAAYGLPSIGTHVGGIPEAVLDNVTGLLVPPGDSVALTAAITRLVRDADLRSRLGRAGMARAAEEFGEARLGAAYLRLLGYETDAT
jgi:glycosyltransferase involved in cell wall biosynthesis